MGHRNRRVCRADCRFILARKEALSIRQKEAIVEFVVNRMLGQKVVCGMYELEEYLEAESEFMDQAIEDKLLESVRKGQTVFSGCISVTDGEGMALLLEDLWKVLEETDNTAFSRIVTRLPV